MIRGRPASVQGETPFLLKSKHSLLCHKDFFPKWLVMWALSLERQAKILQHIFYRLPFSITYCDSKWIWFRQLPRVIFLMEKQCWNDLSSVHPLWLPLTNSMTEVMTCIFHSLGHKKPLTFPSWNAPAPVERKFSLFYSTIAGPWQERGPVPRHQHVSEAIFHPPAPGQLANA